MATGQQSTYVNTVPIKRVVSDRVLMTDPMEIPLVSALGLNADGKFKFVNSPGTVYEWLVDTYSPTSDVVASGAASDSATTTITMTDGSKFQVGDVLLVDAEYIWVSGIATNVITVTRNYGGTQAVHADNSVAYLVSRARLEGADAGDSHFTQVTSQYNYSAIFQKTIEVSRSDARIKRYGIPNLVQYEIDKKMDELKVALTQKPYHGQRKAGSASTPRDMGGFDTFINATNKTNLSSAALTLKNVEDMVQTIWDAGGRPSLLVCGGWAKRKITSFFEGAVRTERSEKLGGVTIDKIQTAMGPQLDVLVDRYIPSSKIYILTPEQVSFVTVDEFFYEDLGKTGDTEAYGQIVGEYGFAMAGDKHHGLIYGVSTTA
jgi:hypothetical protein